MCVKAYLILCGDDLGHRLGLQAYIDTLEDIDYWLTCLPHALFCVSALDAHAIADHLKAYCGRKPFFVMECHPHRQGWLPRRAWEVMATGGKDDGESL